MHKSLVSSMVAIALIGFTANVQAAGNATKGKILVVASSTNTLILKDGKKDPTGYYLDELAVPAQKLIAAGYDVVIATPDGKTPAMDRTSVQVSLFDDKQDLDNALSWVKSWPSMQRPLTLKAAAEKNKEFAGVYVPGGHAPMNDLMQNPDLRRILQENHRQAKPTAFLCHGPVASLAALNTATEYRRALVSGQAEAIKQYGKDWQYAGYNMTIFSNDEEYVIEKDVLHGNVPFYVEDALQAAGAKLTMAPKWQPHVVRDRELITGQNPQSDKELARVLIQALDSK